MVSLIVNDTLRQVDGDPEMPLLWVLRDVLNLKGTKYECGVGVCGICTVLINGEANHEQARAILEHVCVIRLKSRPAAP